jgi:aryl-alcohol dehydrogenase-like predicted oxidoreductase
MSTTRREFLAVTAAAAGGAVASRVAWGQAATEPALWEIPELKTPESAKEGDMLFRKLGKTGEKVSLLGIGGYHMGTLSTEAAGTKLLRRAIDAGVNFMDNCWDYLGGRAEERMGAALKDGYRKKVFLMTKIDGQTKAAASKQIDESLKRLQTDVVDLMQIHENVRMGDAARVFGKAPNEGSVEALLAAKKAGKIRYIGFTGHKSPEIHINMLDMAKKNDFAFDSCQMPLNVMDAQYHSFARGVVPRLVKEGVGVLAMKTLAGGAIVGVNGVTATDCLHYAMNLPTSVVIAGIDSEEILDQALAAVKSFKPFDAAGLGALLAKTKDSAANGRYESFKTSNSYDGTARNPAWLG